MYRTATTLHPANPNLALSFRTLYSGRRGIYYDGNPHRLSQVTPQLSLSYQVLPLQPGRAWPKEGLWCFFSFSFFQQAVPSPDTVGEEGVRG